MRKDSEFVELGDTGRTLENGVLKDKDGQPVKCTCRKHPTYKAVRKPTAACQDCWDFYLDVHGGAVDD